jgi:hypothetical protein
MWRIGSMTFVVLRLGNRIKWYGVGFSFTRTGGGQYRWHRLKINVSRRFPVRIPAAA